MDDEVHVDPTKLEYINKKLSMQLVYAVNSMKMNGVAKRKK